MQTLNTHEDLPEYFYVFMNNLSPVAQHNFDLTKAMSSGAFANIGVDGEFLRKYLAGQVDYLSFMPNNNCDILSPSSFSLATTSNYMIECNAEFHRRQHADTQLYPSRLSCLYAFGDLATCKLASELIGIWNLDDLRRFTLDDQPQLQPLIRVVKVNMSIATTMLDYGNHATFVQQEQDKIWGAYWHGEGDFAIELPWKDKGFDGRLTPTTIWEYLIEGRLVWDESWRYNGADD